MSNKQTVGNLLLILTALIWGVAVVAQRTGMESIEPISFNAARMVLASAALGTVILIMKLKKKSGKCTDGCPDGETVIRKPGALFGGICCGVFLTLATVTQQMGLVYTTAGKAGFITTMYIVLVPIISCFFLGKKQPWLVWLAVLLAIVGMYLLCVSESFSVNRGDILVCVCALFFSGHILCCDHFAHLGDPLRLSFVQFVTAAIMSAVGALIFEAPTWNKFVLAAVPILYCGFMSGGLGYTLQMVAQKITDPTVASLLMSLEAVFAVLAGALMLGERMSTREIVGCTIMFAATIMVQLPMLFAGLHRRPVAVSSGAEEK